MGNIEKSSSGIIDVWPFETFTVTLDPERFDEAAAEGRIKLVLSGNDLELELVEKEIPEEQRKITVINESGIYILGGKELHVYRGKVTGKENSSVYLTIHRDILFGTVDIEENPYYISLTRKSRGGKAVLAVYRQDAVAVYDNVEELL